MDSGALQWGLITVYFSSITLFMAFLLSLIIVLSEGRRKLLAENKIIDFIIVAFTGGIIGARLSYALLFDFNYYFKDNPLHLIQLQDGGLSFWGGLAAALVAASIWAYFKGLVVERYFDAAAVALPLSAAVNAIGTPLAGSEMTQNYFWGIVWEGQPYHPDGAYMILMAMMLFYYIWNKRTKINYDGELFIRFMVGFGAIYMLVELFRDSSPVIWILSAGQMASVAAIIIALFFAVAGSKVYTSGFYRRWRLAPDKQSPLIGFLLLVWYIVLLSIFVILYYQVRQPFIF